MTEIPRRAVQRSAKLAGLPLGYAGRRAAGWGRRLAGGDAAELDAEFTARSAEQLFSVLGELKGGAMKFGQALSVFEAAIPPEYVEPYREALTRLQSEAPPMPESTVRAVLDEQLGRGWPQRFRELDFTPAAAASIGQVHKGVWHDGREVALKVQYPGADAALTGDLRQLRRFSRLFQAFVPAMEVKPLLIELQERMSEELDYRLEADYQRRFATEFDGDALIRVPKVVASSPKVMVSEWLYGTPMSEIIASGGQEQRRVAAERMAEFHFSSPARCGLLHADPHPGNFMLGDDGKLTVIDFGACAELPNGLPRPLGELCRLSLAEDSEGVQEVLLREGFLQQRSEVSADDVQRYLHPMVEPLASRRFHFTRAWLRGQAERLGDLRSPEFHTGREFNLPPQYLLVHRVTMGSIGVMCQLEAEVGLREILLRWAPGFEDIRPERSPGERPANPAANPTGAAEGTGQD